MPEKNLRGLGQQPQALRTDPPYRYQEMADGFIGDGASLSKDEAVLVPGGQIIYRTLHSSMVRYSGRYVLEKQGSESVFLDTEEKVT